MTLPFSLNSSFRNRYSQKLLQGVDLWVLFAIPFSENSSLTFYKFKKSISTHERDVGEMQLNGDDREIGMAPETSAPAFSITGYAPVLRVFENGGIKFTASSAPSSSEAAGACLSCCLPCQ
jgi:hypothetical protein